MLLKEHRKILKFIITKWKNEKGRIVYLDESGSYFQELHILTKLDNDHLKTAIYYLEHINLIKRPPHIADIKQFKFVPTSDGLEHDKYWLFKEKNYKWYIGIVLTISGYILGKIIK